ncbi:MAG: CBS domain-containing protein [Deltaproteobacteria bacterium]|nr:CBS domain-containing protein [Deltaproteobacteria bacterium]
MEISKPVLSYLKKTYESFLYYTHASQTTYITMIAAVVGIMGGFGAVGFRMLIEFFQNLSINSPVHILGPLKVLPWYVKILIPFIGASIVGPLVYFFAREAKGHGVPEVMQDVALKNGVIRPRVVIVKSLASAITIGTGGSVGREGPIAQIGSAIGSPLGQWLNLSPERLKILVGCGAAAGIAATFNAPIAGAFFALEIILGSFAMNSFGPIIISSVLATAVSRAFLGDIPAFIVPEYAMVSVWEIPLYMILGMLAGVLAVCFSKSVYLSEDLFAKLPIPDYLKNPIGGLVIGVGIIFFPEIYGVGYEAIDAALAGKIVFKTALALIFIKLLATSITLGSGGSGGIFAPSLFLGAVFGSLFGMGVNYLMPGITAHSGAYALVCMGAVVAGATHTPITSILILFELTNDYKIILAVMLACTVSTIVSKKLSQDSIYTQKLSRRGIALNQGREELIMKSFSVAEVIKADTPTIQETASFNQIIKKFMESNEPYYYIINQDSQYIGVLSAHEIKSLLSDTELQDLVIARDLIDYPVNPVTIQNNLAECMEMFEREDLEHLPVVMDETSNKLVGRITRGDIIELYNREILRKDVLSLQVDQQIGFNQKRKHVALPKEYQVEYIPVPDAFINHSISQLGIRARYNLNILAIKNVQSGSSQTSDNPNPDRLFRKRDIMVVVGKIEDLKQFETDIK